VLNVDQAFKRMHGQNMQLEFLGAALGDLHQRKSAFDILFRDCPDGIPDRERLEQLARQSIAEEAFWAASRAFDRGDVVRCQEFLLFALDIYPRLQTRPQWQRLHWKRRVGPKLWNLLRPIVERLRGRGNEARGQV
jgi:hypothetical protein